MKIGLYTIYDEAANDIGPVFVARTDAVSIRKFKEVIKEHQFLDELQLWRLGYLKTESYNKKDVDLLKTTLVNEFEVIILGNDCKSEEDQNQLAMFMDYKNKEKKDA